MRYTIGLLFLFLTIAASVAKGDSAMSYALDAIPEGYVLYMYDDCGVAGRQPHVRMDDSYCWTFQTSDTDADERSRSAVFSYKPLNFDYNDLDPKLSYVLVMTYASDHVYNRVQSLEADSIELHGPLALPKAVAIRRIVRVPEEVTRDGKMHLEIKIHGDVNATCSIAELWATAPPPVSLQIGSVSASHDELFGRVYGPAWYPVAGATISVKQGQELARAQSDSEGSFAVKRSDLAGMTGDQDVEIAATYGGQTVTKTIPASVVQFSKPVHYRPIPEAVGGLKESQLSLDGAWRISAEAPEKAREIALDQLAWKPFSVPGQWLQQGYDFPQDRSVAVAREFTIPEAWKGYRVMLRFDSIHAGTRYRLNGKEIGASENLFTPVEWDITDTVKIGAANRLDLEMKVDTLSEKLSISSGYAFHSLGGIDRSVRLYALPPIHVKQLHIETDLDKDYRDADLKLKLALDRPERGISLQVKLYDPKGRLVKHSIPEVNIGSQEELEIVAHVSNPLKWNAEKPRLYRLALELKQGEKLLERIERNVGFRKIEVRGSLLYVNGVVVKLAGACRHEGDPLTGRADTMRHAETDVKLLKSANLNYIRTSHYPPPKELLDACDKLGMYVEVEAPFCWVGASDSWDGLKEVLTPTSAMIDYCHVHPSVIVWSLANESNFNPVFEISNRLCKELDPTRPTTFNNPDPKRLCDIANYHYPSMPYDNLDKSDLRPIFLGEYFFPVCHEQTDVMIDPGLRELWGHGKAEPDSDWAKFCSKSYDTSYLKPGARPGVWDSIYRSKRVIGGAIWAAFDEPFYFKDREHCGYAWHHGFWGLLDAWRRPKPEYWLAKWIFSPVWFTKRHVEFSPGQKTVKVPVENRYAFTDLKELKFAWEIGKKKGTLKFALAPGSAGEMEIPIPEAAAAGDKVILRVTDAAGELVNALAIDLGKAQPKPLPSPNAGAPKWSDDGKKIAIEGNGFALVINRKTADLEPGHDAAVTHLPSLHVTQYDFHDLAPGTPPYAIFPDAKTRVVEGVEAKEIAEGLEITVKDRYDRFSGTMRWLIDRDGKTKVSYDYSYHGEEMNAREIGVRFALKPGCETLKWRRWSEWGVFPEDDICRTVGIAKARRDAKLPDIPEYEKPKWSWSQDQTELGTNDFRGIKFNVYEATLTAPDGKGLSVHANADAHVRACLAPDGVLMHVLKECQMGQIVIRDGDKLKGEFVVGMVR